MAAGPFLGGVGVGWGGARLRGRGSGRQVAASGCRSAAWSAFQPADLAGLWGCTAGPKGDAAAAWAGNRTRASRVAGENSTTEPPMHRWPTPPDAAPEALTATRPAPLTARLSPVGIYLLHRSRRRRWGAGRGGDLKARIRARAGPQGAALSEGPTRPVARLLRRPRPPRPCRCRPRGPGADAVCPAPRSPVRCRCRCRRRRCVDAAAARRRSSQRPPGPDPKACEPGSCALADRAPEVRL